MSGLPLHPHEFKSVGHSYLWMQALCVCTQTVQQILKQPSEDVMAVSQNQTAKGRFLFE